MARILLVDDSAFSRLGIRRLLGDRHDVVEASSGAEALRVVGSVKPDCIILDLLMPVMSGLEVMGRLKDMAIAVPVIVPTADIQKTTEQRCLESGASEVLHKPCSQERMDAAFARVLRAKRSC